MERRQAVMRKSNVHQDISYLRQDDEVEDIMGNADPVWMK